MKRVVETFNLVVFKSCNLREMFSESESESEHSSSGESSEGSDFELIEERDPAYLDLLWLRPESPVEDFDEAEGGNADGKWNVEIIGEEVDGDGEVRYEARWPSWKRADGTNTTWDNGLVDPHDYAAWKKLQTQWRNTCAKQSTSITLWSTTDVQNIETRLRAQAYKEKIDRLENDPPPSYTEAKRKLDEEYWAEVAADSQRNDVGPSSRPHKRVRAVSPEIELPVASSSRQSITSPSRSPSVISLPGRPRESRSASLSKAAASSSNRYITPPYSSASTSSASKGKGKGKRIAPEPSPPRQYQPLTPSRSPSARPQRSLQTRPQATNPRKSLRRQLAEAWTSIAMESGAAEIVLINEVDDEEVPPLPLNFRYMESGYVYASDIEDFTKEKDLYIRCDCEHCDDANTCDCQGPSELMEDEDRIFAYENGLFAFNVPNGIEVIECNEYCECDGDCPNRVAQRPRAFPLEIFKTERCGWGVRASVDIERGRVLGTYAGLLLNRDTHLQSSYCFDLDGNENLDDDDNSEGNAYSVDSADIGNWTRFINHSCSPNLSVYSVVYDTIPGTNQPYHAYYAIRDIPAGTEFTFDYDPKAAKLVAEQARGKKKGKQKGGRPKGARDCCCGSPACRGWVRV